MLPGSILQYFWPALCDIWSWKKIVFECSLKTGLTVYIKFNGYPIREIQKINFPTDQPIPVKQHRVRGNKNIFKVGLIYTSRFSYTKLYCKIANSILSDSPVIHVTCVGSYKYLEACFYAQIFTYPCLQVAVLHTEQPYLCIGIA